MKMKYMLAEMTTIEAKEAFKRTDLAILPVGSTEVHGPHNPLFTDSNMAYELTRRVGEKMNGTAIVAPLISYGYCPYHMDFEGSITLRQETLLAIIRDVTDGLVHWGIRRLLIFSGHGGNLNAITTVGYELCRKGILVAYPGWWEAGIVGKLDPRWAHEPDHGGFKETMVNLVTMPDAVRMDLYVPAKIKYQMTEKMHSTYFKAEFKGIGTSIALSTKTAWPHGFAEYGIPANEATQEEGERMVEALAGYYAEFLDEFRKIPPPQSRE